MAVIARVANVAFLGRVPVPHTNEAVYALDAAGRRWVAKREANMGCEAMLAEAVTWLLARRIGAPVPDAAFVDDDGGRSWLSAWVPHAKHWSVATAGVIGNAPEAAAILALDAVVLNEARHAGNVLVVPDGNGGSHVVAIDGDEALIGHPRELALRGLKSPDPRILAPGFPPPGWRTNALAAAARCAALSRKDIFADASEACRVAREPAVDLLTRILIERCANAVALTEAYVDVVESRQ